MYLYLIQNAKNKKVYVGKSVRPVSHRWTRHLRALEKGVQCALYSAMKKYGVGAFSISTLSEHSSKEELKNAEKEAIREFSSLCPNGYNMTLGGEGGGMLGHRHSEATRLKMRESAIRRGQKPPSYDSLSEDNKKKLLKGGYSNRGRIRSEETKLRISRSKMGSIPWNKRVAN